MGKSSNSHGFHPVISLPQRPPRDHSAARPTRRSAHCRSAAPPRARPARTGHAVGSWTGNPWEIHGKSMGKHGKIHGKSMFFGKTWEKHGTIFSRSRMRLGPLGAEGFEHLMAPLHLPASLGRHRAKQGLGFTHLVGRFRLVTFP